MPGEGEDRFQFRVTADAAANVERMYTEHWLDQRMCVAVAFEIANLFCLDAEARRLRVPQFDADVLERVVAAGWAAAHFVQSRHRVRGEKKVTYTVDVDAAQKRALEACAATRDLHLGPVVATAYTPWSPRWGPKWCELGDPAYELRAELFKREAHAERAPALERKKRSSVDEIPDGADELPGGEQD